MQVVHARNIEEEFVGALEDLCKDFVKAYQFIAKSKTIIKTTVKTFCYSKNQRTKEQKEAGRWPLAGGVFMSILMILIIHRKDQHGVCADVWWMVDGLSMSRRRYVEVYVLPLWILLI
ncbi:hypothetical protein BZA77DRAFT_292395 [Pyronema omphalodes]|nr:hypothetical protein BZA77DRAFT_292395 [Pyronema omphalodes]